MSDPYNQYPGPNYSSPPPAGQGYPPPGQQYGHNQGYEQQGQGYGQPSYPQHQQSYGTPGAEAYGPPQTGGFQHGDQQVGQYGAYDASNPHGQQGYQYVLIYPLHLLQLTMLPEASKVRRLAAMAPSQVNTPANHLTVNNNILPTTQTTHSNKVPLMILMLPLTPMPQRVSVVLVRLWREALPATSWATRPVTV